MYRNKIECTIDNIGTFIKINYSKYTARKRLPTYRLAGTRTYSSNLLISTLHKVELYLYLR